jgi:hypothetical protein
MPRRSRRVSPGDGTPTGANCNRVPSIRRGSRHSNQLTDVMAGRPCPWLHHQSSLRCCGVAARKGRLNGGVLHQRGQLNLSGECLDPPRAAIPERRIKVADRPMPDTGFPFAFLRSGYRLSGGKVDRKTRSGINVNQELMTELTAERVGDYSRDRRK